MEQVIGFNGGVSSTSKGEDMSKKKNVTLRISPEEIEKRLHQLGEELGLDDNVLFITTAERYMTQVRTMQKLQDIIDEEGALVEKEYVKGRGNVYVHPAITCYNSTATSANQTAITLVKIISHEGKEGAQDAGEEIMSFLTGKK